MDANSSDPIECMSRDSWQKRSRTFSIKAVKVPSAKAIAERRYTTDKKMDTGRLSWFFSSNVAGGQQRNVVASTKCRFK
jgi:hypothetical protein